jgi:hypothetical protein
MLLFEANITALPNHCNFLHVMNTSQG